MFNVLILDEKLISFFQTYSCLVKYTMNTLMIIAHLTVR